MVDIFNYDFQDFLISLNKFNVEYVLVGGYSVIIHGYNRTTGDMDLFVNKTKDNYIKLVHAFNDFHMSIFDMNEYNFLHNNDYDVFTFGVSPVSIDIMTRMKGFNFDEVYSSAIKFEIDENLSINVIHINQLLISKEIVGRHKDLDDIENLKKSIK